MQLLLLFKFCVLLLDALSYTKACGRLQAAVTPVIGSAGAVYNRIFLTAAGTIIWGATSAGTALASSLAKARSHLRIACLFKP